MADSEKWEYMTRIFYADIDNQGVKDYLRQTFPNWKNPPKYTPSAMVPDLNSCGEKGWELVHIQPVFVGGNADIMGAVTGAGFTNAYFCVFKRRK
jgi:hypothetical protein